MTDFKRRQAAEDVLVKHVETGKVLTIPRATLRAAPDKYQTIHNKFVEPTALEVARAITLAPQTTWKAPNLDAERAEFERAEKLLDTPADALLDAARNAPTVPLSDAMWSAMENTDSWGTNTVEKAIEYARLYDKDIRDLILGLGGSMETPMVVRRPDGGLMLVGGNTRLMTFRAFGLRPKVLLIPLPVNFSLCGSRSTMSKNPAAEFKHALLVRNVVARFVSAATIHDIETVKGVAKKIDPKIKVTLEKGEIVLRAGKVEERYDTPEEAIAGLRASW